MLGLSGDALAVISQAVILLLFVGLPIAIGLKLGLF
jgi:hypothetical protein